MDDDDLGVLMRSLLDGRSEDAERIIRQVGGKKALAAIAAMFTVAVERQFEESATPAVVSEFVSDLRSRYPNGHRVDPILAEALVRSALGEEGLLDDLDLNGMETIEGFIATAIVDSKGYRPEELDAFIVEAVEFAQQGLAEAAE